MNQSWIKEQLNRGTLQTPCYIFDMDVLRAHVEKMKACIDGRASLCYAMKANPFLIRALSGQIEKIEVCSPGELEICKKQQISPTSIIFSGVNKTRENIEAALFYGVNIITLESVKHWHLLKEICTEKEYTGIQILPRLTNGSQFGMNEQELLSVIEEAAALSQFEIMGVHYFSGTQKKKMEKLTEELQMLDALMARLKNEYQLNHLTLEYGAGLFVPYFEGEDFGVIYENLSALSAAIADIHKTSVAEYKTVLELGRFFAFSCGTYLTKVDDVKNNGGHYYVIVDGGIHQLNYYGQNMAMRVPKMELMNMNMGASEMELRKQDEGDEPSFESTICGSLCTMADVLVRKWNGPLPSEGDYFAFHNAGSYSMTEAPALFLSRTMPQIYSYTADAGLGILRPFQEAYEANAGAFQEGSVLL